MKSTILITSILILYFSSSVSAQKATKLEEFAKDPKTAEMAAKADVYILSKKISNDTSAFTKPTADKMNHKKRKKHGKQL